MYVSSKYFIYYSETITPDCMYASGLYPVISYKPGILLIEATILALITVLHSFLT
jgi:hypothetical protein